MHIKKAIQEKIDIINSMIADRMDEIMLQVETIIKQNDKDIDKEKSEKPKFLLDNVVVEHKRSPRNGFE